MKRIELHAKTKYSMDHESTIDIKNLILKCIENGERGVAIVDTGSVISFLKAEKTLKELNIEDFKLVYGVELDVFYKDNTYKVVVLVKNKKGISSLYKELNVYNNHKKIPLSWLIKLRTNFVLGLVYDKDKYNYELLQYMDYIEVNNDVSKEDIEELKKEICVVYSNKINALSKEEELSKKVLYNKLRIKKEVDNRIYQTTEEILNKIDDKEIVVDNSNQIFDMIEKFELIDDEIILPNNNGFDFELLTYIELNEKFGFDVPKKISNRVEEELKLIHEYKYDGFLNIYKELTDKCKELNEEYIINDYTNYLYIAYLLGITHLDPIKAGLNYDIFFSNYPKISINGSENMCNKVMNFIKNDLGINTIRGKSLMKMDGYMLNNSIDRYEEKNNLKLSLKEKNMISKYLNDYPINNNFLTLKEIVFPFDLEKDNYTSKVMITDDKNIERYYTEIDYKDIEHKFMTIELLSNDKVTKLNELKNITGDKISVNDYKNKKIINRDEFKNYLKIYENCLILDDLYEELVESDIELPDVFNIINEIKRNKIISKRTKDILIKNNIKLKKYHNINFISRGILNENVRLEYELLYFKEYYPLEYYYIMLKDCPFGDVIQIAQKGYNELVTKINGYLEYKYEYKYLTLVKELYESNINFNIYEKMITEDYYFKLDKVNNEIALVINEITAEITKYLSNDLSLIGTRPVNGKMPYIGKLLYKLLEKNKNITLFGLNGPINYYLEYLLNEITKIDRKSIHQYLNPCSCYNDEILWLDKDKYMDGLNYLLYHDLSIKDYHSVNDTIIEKANTLLDKILYMINNSDNKVVIIDNIENIKSDLKEVLKIFKKISKEKDIHFIIFTNLKREYEKTYKKDISSFGDCKVLDKHIDYISILDSEKLHVIKENVWES